MERWVQVGCAPEYSISSLGRLRSVYTNRPLRGGLDKDGYRKAVLCTGGRRVHARIATLVCEAFHGPRPAGFVVRHLDGKRTNDVAENLEWSTQKDNISDKERHGTAQRGERSGLAKLTEAEVIAIRGSNATPHELAAQYGVSYPTIYAILSRRNWRHI